MVFACVVVGAACSGSDGGSASRPAGDGADAAAAAPAEWVRLGRDLANSRAAVDETAVSPDTVGQLQPTWELTDVNGVTGTPIVADGTVYVGDWTGHVRALDAETGDEQWATDLDSYYIGGAVVVDESRAYVGTFDARIVALDRADGVPVWETPVGDHPQAVVFGSPIVVDDLVIAGVGSFEVFTSGDTPTFRGHVVALDAETGAEQWRFWVTAGDETEGPGVSVWSSPAVDADRGQLYIGTGQAYAQPAPPRSDALLALDVATGEEVWSTQFTAGDAWTLSQPTGLDADVGAPPNLFQVDGTDAVGVGDKAGVYHVLDRDTGDELWSRELTEGGTQGGVMASAAVEGDRIYVTSNDASRDAELFALDRDTGDVVWQVGVDGHVTGPVTWANGVVFVADDTGRIAGFAAEDGERLWSHEVAAPAAGGIAVVDGVVYAGWGWWLTGAPDEPQGGLIAFEVGGDGGEDDAGEASGDDEAAGALGEEIYQQSCATCHGASGDGGSGPSLRGVADRLTRDEHIEIVRDGRGNMPPWEDRLSAEEIQAVVDYERSVLSSDDGP